MTPTFLGRLRISPYAGLPIPAMAHPAVLESDTDFIAMALMARRGWAPVLLSFSQRHDLMSRICRSIDETLGTAVDRILLHSRVPAGGRMPAMLARETVFIVAKLEPEIRRLLDLGFSFLSIHEGFVRHPLEIGDNEIEIAWHNPPADGAERFDALKSALVELGFETQIGDATPPPSSIQASTRGEVKRGHV